jgi:hypothetical protein
MRKKPFGTRGGGVGRGQRGMAVRGRSSEFPSGPIILLVGKAAYSSLCFRIFELYPCVKISAFENDFYAAEQRHAVSPRPGQI